MGCRHVSLALLLVLAVHAGNAAGQTPVFLLDTDEATFVTVFRVEPATGALTMLGSLPTTLGPIAGLAAANDNLLYAVAQGGDVLQITVSPFGSVSLGNIGVNQISGLAFADGGLFAIDEGMSSLVRIELAPLSVALVGDVRFPDGTALGIGGGDLAQDGAGHWFLWTNATSALYSLDVSNASVTPVPAQVMGEGFLTGLAFDYLGGGALLASSRDFDPLQTLDPASGATLSGVGLCLDCPTPYDIGFGDLASARHVSEPDPDPDPDPEPEPEPEFACPHGKGFWKRHTRDWPVDGLMLGNDMYGKRRLFFLLIWPVHGDASMKLGQQLIAAKLNLAAGSDPAPIAQTVADADALLAAFPGRLPDHVRTRSRAGRAMLAAAHALAEYNGGDLTPVCVP
jgi:hypothetical protein